MWLLQGRDGLQLGQSCSKPSTSRTQPISYGKLCRRRASPAPHTLNEGMQSIGALHRNLRALSGTRPAVRGHGRGSLRGVPTRGSCSWAGSRRRSRRPARRSRATAWRMPSCSPGSGRPRRSRRISTQPRSSSRRDRPAPTRRSRSINTSDRAGRSSPPTCARIRRCSPPRSRSLAPPRPTASPRRCCGPSRIRPRPARGRARASPRRVQVQRRRVHQQDQQAFGLLFVTPPQGARGSAA